MITDDDFSAVRDGQIAADQTHLTDAQLAEVKHQRGLLRAAISKYYKKVLRSGHRTDPKTVEEVDAWGERLDNYDETIGDEDNSYSSKLGEIRARLEADTVAAISALSHNSPAPSPAGVPSQSPPTLPPFPSQFITPLAASSFFQNSVPNPPHLSSLISPFSSLAATSAASGVPGIPAVQHGLPRHKRPPDGAHSLSTIQRSCVDSTSFDRYCHLNNNRSTSSSSIFTTASFGNPISSTGAGHPTTLLPPLYQAPPVFARPNDAKVAPFDGTFGDYSRFETAFIAKYINNPCYTHADQFLKLVELTGEHGRDFTMNQPMDASGLQAALILMRDYYNNPSRIRTEVRRKLDALPPVLQDQTNPLRVHDQKLAAGNILACQTAIRQLRDCGTSPQYLNEDFYRVIVKKMPYAYASEYGRQNPIYKDTQQMVTHCRDRLRQEENFDEDVQPSAAPAAATTTKGSRAHVNTISGSPIQKQPNTNNKCLLCEGAHYTFKCRAGSAADRAAKVAQKNLCQRCLRDGHQLSDCHSSYQCPCGSADHSSIICAILEGQRNARRQSANNNRSSHTHTPPPAAATSASPTLTSPTVTSSSIASVAVVGHQKPTVEGSSSTGKKIVIPGGFYSQTVLVRVQGQTVRALLDSGAQPTVILRSLAEQLQLAVTPAALKISGALGTSESQTLTTEVSATVESLTGHQSVNISCHQVDNINFECNHLPTSTISKLRKKGYKLKHTSEESMKQYPVSLIIGAGYHGAVFRGQGPRDVCPGFSIARSVFGHAILGHVRGNSAAAQINSIITATKLKWSTAVPDKRVDLDADKTKAQRCTGINLITTKNNQPKVRLPKNKPITKTEPKTMLAKTEARVADRPRIITIITSKKAEPPTVLAKTEEQVCDRPHFTRTNDNREPVSPFSFPTRGRRLGTQPTVGIQNHADQQRPEMKDAHHLMTNWRSTFRSGSEKELHHYHQNYRPPNHSHSDDTGDSVTALRASVPPGGNCGKPNELDYYYF
ncbi:hypothetical protein TYRP_014282 [Tyrophagus putrescentiae]|nr:hypothetical protein TYRP_014282 [Tyrophagus putrescentiae]